MIISKKKHLDLKMAQCFEVFPTIDFFKRMAKKQKAAEATPNKSKDHPPEKEGKTDSKSAGSKGHPKVEEEKLELKPPDIEIPATLPL